MNKFSWEKVLCLLKCFPLLKKYIPIGCRLMVAALPAIGNDKTQVLYCLGWLIIAKF